MVALVHAGHAATGVDHHAGAFVAKDRRKQSFGIGAGQRELVGVADARGLDFDQHFALARPLELDGRYLQRLAGGDSNGSANIHGHSLFSIFVMPYRASRPAQMGVAAQHMIGQSGRQMNHNLEHLAARAAPAIFVVLWSTGFIATKYVLHDAEPLTYLTIRMAVVVGLMAVIVAIARPKWPDGIGIAHSVVAGVLVHGFYLGGTAVAIAHSIPAGLSALIPGLQPILTSTLANRWLGERVTPLQWSGLLLGLAGVVLILHDRPMSGEAGWGWLASGVSLVSITLGTLYQRRYCGKIDWRAGNLVQYIAVTIFFAAGAWLFESNVVRWTSEFVLALTWLAVVLSIGSIGLLYWLIRRSAATSVASLFYLVPAVTAVMAYVLFGERLDTVAIAGMVACAAAVFLVNRRG